MHSSTPRASSVNNNRVRIMMAASSLRDDKDLVSSLSQREAALEQRERALCEREQEASSAALSRAIEMTAALRIVGASSGASSLAAGYEAAAQKSNEPRPWSFPLRRCCALW